MDTTVRNVRYAIRRLAKSPSFTAIAVLSLGLGIGANTAMFSLVNAVIFRDKPFEEPDRLVDVYESSVGFSHGTLSYPDYLDLLEGSTDVFSDVGGGQLAALNADAGDAVELLLAEAVTGNYFGLLGIRPARGRMLGSEDHVDRGAHPVVVLSHAYWVERFAASPDAVGSELRLSGRPYTVVGVAPEDFTGSLRGLEPSVWVPIMMYDELQGLGGNTLEARGNQAFFARARLLPGSTIAQARAVVERVATRLRVEYPDQWAPEDAFVLEPTAEVIMNPMVDRYIVPAAALVMAVVGMVLLIACANLASFLLARAADRRKEIAVRLAMGASRPSLIGQLMTETVMLASIGGVAGIWLATYALRALMTADLPLPLPITLDLRLDGTVLGFSILISMIAGLLFGLVPALQSTNPDLATTLRDETAGGGRARGALLRDVLVAGQVAVSVVLLVGAGLFLRSLDASREIDPGFGHQATAILQLTVSADRYDDAEATEYLERLTNEIADVPGVEAVGMIDNLHLNQLNTQFVRVAVGGIDPPPGRDFHLVDFGRIDEDFLDAAGISLVEGRGFEEADNFDGQPVVLVSEEFSRTFFPRGGAVGGTIRVNGNEKRVVGVTADHKVRQLGEAPRPYVYESLNQSFSNLVHVVARTTGDDDRLALDMLAAARRLDPSIMVIETKTMERHLATMLVGRELGALVIGGFAALALLLASIGVYGVVSHAVSKRSREVGIRLSLGADNGQVVRMLTAGGLKLALAGALVGITLAAGAANLLSRLLFGVPALDPLTFVGVPLILTLVAFLASWVPARRVIRIDPVRALRAE
ncbi:MAG: ABC transporter permease [Gemmatimonadota bacterium]|nr:ABC transporter permease [Gemmatimonadota bacterium]